MNRLTRPLASAAAVALLAGCGGGSAGSISKLHDTLADEGLCPSGPQGKGDLGFLEPGTPGEDRVIDSFRCEGTHMTAVGFKDKTSREKTARYFQDKGGRYMFAGTDDNLWVIFIPDQSQGQVLKLLGDGIRPLEQ